MSVEARLRAMGSSEPRSDPCSPSPLPERPAVIRSMPLRSHSGSSSPWYQVRSESSPAGDLLGEALDLVAHGPHDQPQADDQHRHDDQVQQQDGQPAGDGPPPEPHPRQPIHRGCQEIDEQQPHDERGEGVEDGQRDDQQQHAGARRQHAPPRRGAGSAVRSRARAACLPAGFHRPGH